MTPQQRIQDAIEKIDDMQHLVIVQLERDRAFILKQARYIERMERLLDAHVINWKMRLDALPDEE